MRFLYFHSTFVTNLKTEIFLSLNLPSYSLRFLSSPSFFSGNVTGTSSLEIEKFILKCIINSLKHTFFLFHIAQLST